MKFLLLAYLLITTTYPVSAVTTRMFKVLDTCARYRIGEIDASEAKEKLKLKSEYSSINNSKNNISKYCSVFTPNEKIEY
tara:strand:- start:257 stop:496 length:240 start_codon:yes stop_codon:yes gene_type:complete